MCRMHVLFAFLYESWHVQYVCTLMCKCAYVHWIMDTVMLYVCIFYAFCVWTIECINLFVKYIVYIDFMFYLFLCMQEKQELERQFLSNASFSSWKEMEVEEMVAPLRGPRSSEASWTIRRRARTFLTTWGSSEEYKMKKMTVWK